MIVGVGQQREEARPLDGIAQLSLVTRGRAGQTCRDDLARLGDEVLQGFE